MKAKCWTDPKKKKNPHKKNQDPDLIAIWNYWDMNAVLWLAQLLFTGLDQIPMSNGVHGSNQYTERKQPRRRCSSARSPRLWDTSAKDTLNPKSLTSINDWTNVDGLLYWDLLSHTHAHLWQSQFQPLLNLTAIWQGPTTRTVWEESTFKLPFT